MSDLIEQLEKATKADPLLDDALAYVAGYTFAGATFGGKVSTFRNSDGDYIGVAPRFTESIDAALKLVPKGYDWDVSHIHENERPGAYVMWVEGIADEAMAKRLNCIVGSPVNWSEHGKGATPAIALCIAALKARESRPTAERDE